MELVRPVSKRHSATLTSSSYSSITGSAETAEGRHARKKNQVLQYIVFYGM